MEHNKCSLWFVEATSELRRCRAWSCSHDVARRLWLSCLAWCTDVCYMEFCTVDTERHVACTRFVMRAQTCSLGWKQANEAGSDLHLMCTEVVACRYYIAIDYGAVTGNV